MRITFTHVVFIGREEIMLSEENSGVLLKMLLCFRQTGEMTFRLMLNDNNQIFS